VDWLLLIVPAVAAGAALAALGQRVMVRAGEPNRRARIVAGVGGVAAGLTWCVFALDLLIYSVRENGPTYDPSSAYMEYRTALDFFGPAALLAGLGYALLAAGAVICAGLAYRRLGRVAAGLVAVLGCIAIALPALLPGALPRSEVPNDATVPGPLPEPPAAPPGGDELRLR
jgi:hypothetical protein